MRFLLSDLKLAVRTLARRPGFALLSAGAIAIGIAATTTVLGVKEGLLSRPLPGLVDSERIVEIGRTDSGNGFDTFSYPVFVDLSYEIGCLDYVSAWRSGAFSYNSGCESDRVSGLLASADYFNVLGLTPALGAFFSSETDIGLNEHPVVVVSHGFWQNRLGADRAIVGKTIDLNRVLVTVIGVAPQGFRGHLIGFAADVWVPLSLGPTLSLMNREDYTCRGCSGVLVIGRLSADGSVSLADLEVRTHFATMADDFPDLYDTRSGAVKPYGPIPGVVRGAATGFVVALFGFVVLILLITCSNVAGMLIARTMSRQKEIAVRMAVGSGRGNVLRLVMAESMVLFVLGGALGIFFAYLAGTLLSNQRLPLPVELVFDFTPAPGVLLVGVCLALVAGLIFGLGPALQGTRVGPARALRSSGRGSSGRMRLRRLFVVAQVALSLLLLGSAALFLRSLNAVQEIDVGFDAESVYLTSVDLSVEGYRTETEVRLAQSALLAGVVNQPGVRSAALASDLPLDLGARGGPIYPGDWTPRDADRPQTSVDFNEVSPDYFRTLGIQILQGRGFDETDTSEGILVVVIDQTLAELIWPGVSPIGRQLRFNTADGPPATVVGVVSAVKNQTVTESAKPFLYLPLSQGYEPATSVIVRAEGAIDGVAPLIRGGLLSSDPNLSLAQVTPLSAVTGLGVLPQRIAAWVSTVLGSLALVLSALGLYGVVAYFVVEQRADFGLRMALGATPRDIVTLVTRQGLRLALPGLILGSLLAMGAAQLLRSLLIGVGPLDPMSLLGGTAVLTLVVMVASFVPARRASKVDPMDALRYE